MMHYTLHMCQLQIIKLVVVHISKVTLIYFSEMNLYYELLHDALYTTHVSITNY